MQQIHLIVDPLIKGIRQVAFSKCGKYLAASDIDEDHHVAIYDLTKKKGNDGKAYALIASGKGTRSEILSMGFNPAGDTLVLTCVKDLIFIKWEADGLLKVQKGTGWGTNGADVVRSQAFVGQTLFTGTSKGEIISWNAERKLINR